MTITERFEIFRDIEEPREVFLRRIGIRPGTWKNWEFRLFKGEKPSPRVETLEMPAKILNVPIAWLMGLDPELPNSARIAQEIKQKALRQEAQAKMEAANNG